jgi:outer membrane lipoprotein-sorting protein
MKIFKNLCLVFLLTLSAAIGIAAQTTAAPKPATPVAAPKTETKPTVAATLPKADDLIDKFVAATGGKAAYKKLNSFYTKGTMEIPAAGIKGTFESYNKAPNKNAISMTIPGVGDFNDVFDGSKSWSVDPINGAREKTGEELAQTKLNSDFYRFVRLKELFPKRETKGIEKVEGADAYAVVLTAGDTAQTYYFDAKTNYLVRIDQTVVSPEGKAPAKTFLSDYRKVEGVLMPFTMRLETPAAGLTFKSEEIKANVPVDDAKFAKPVK